MTFYKPDEDSYLLEKAVSSYISKNKNKNLKCLDLGTGSAIQAKNLIKNNIKKSNIFSSDINDDALKQAKKLGVNTKKSNIFENINQNFDLIIFNPPYLPENKYDKKIDTTGGKKGDETIIKFIKELNSHMTKKAVCFLLTSSFTPEKKWKLIANKNNLIVKKISKKHIFHETLYVWKITYALSQ